MKDCLPARLAIFFLSHQYGKQFTHCDLASGFFASGFLSVGSYTKWVHTRWVLAALRAPDAQGRLSSSGSIARGFRFKRLNLEHGETIFLRRRGKDLLLSPASTGRNQR